MACLPSPVALMVALVAAGSAARAGDGVHAVWTAPVGEARGAAVAALHVVGGLVVAADARGGITALRVRDGGLAWFVQHPGIVTLAPCATEGDEAGGASEGAAIAFSSGDRVLLVDAASGRRRREFRLPAPLAEAAVCDAERLYAPLLLDDAVVALDLATGRQAWTLRLPAPVAAPLLRVGDAGWVAWLDDGTLRGFRPGPLGAAEVWVRREGRPAGPPVVDGAQVLIATDGRTLVSIDGASGRVAWRFSADEELSGAPIPVGDVVLVGGERGALAVRRGRDGGPPAVAWTAPGETPLARLGASVALRAADGAVLRRDGATGARREGGAPAGVRWAGGGLAVDHDGAGRVRAWSEAR